MTTATVIEMLQAPFFREALSGSLLAGAICGLLGPYMVWRRLGLMGDSISHASLTAVAGALYFQLPLNAVLFPFALVISLLLAWIEEQRLAEADSVLAVFFAGFLAVGVLIMTAIGQGSTELVHVLLGEILLVSKGDLLLLGLVLAAILIFLWVSRWQLALILLHPDLARIEGFPVRRTNYLLLALVGLTVAACLKLMGVILLTALLMVPPMTARVFSKTLRGQIVWSLVISVSLALFGTVFAFLLDWPTGPAIAGLGLLVYLGAMGSRVASFRQR